MPRSDGRATDALRPVEMILGFHRPSEGSVLYRAGGTVTCDPREGGGTRFKIALPIAPSRATSVRARSSAVV